MRVPDSDCVVVVPKINCVVSFPDSDCVEGVPAIDWVLIMSESDSVPHSDCIVGFQTITALRVCHKMSLW